MFIILLGSVRTVVGSEASFAVTTSKGHARVISAPSRAESALPSPVCLDIISGKTGPNVSVVQ